MEHQSGREQKHCGRGSLTHFEARHHQAAARRVTVSTSLRFGAVQNAIQGHAGPLVDQCKRRKDEHTRQQIKTQQVEHGKANGKKERSD